MNAASCVFESAPTLVASTLPFLKSMSVGMPRMPYLGGVDLEPPRVLGGDLVERRRDHLARAAPLRPVVHQDRGLGLEDFLLEGVVRDVDDFLVHCVPLRWDMGSAAGDASVARAEWMKS